MTVIDLEGLRKTFPNEHSALVDLSFTVNSGEFVCIVGRSGAGKSTLMRCLNGSLPITSGTASISGFDLSTLSTGDRRKLQRSVGFIYQEFNLVGRLSALQNVLTGRLGGAPGWQAVCMYFSRADREAALRALERVNMLHKAPQRADSLSGGEKQRVAIARAIAQEPAVLLADEPVANLDPELADGVLKDLRNAAKDAAVTTLVNIHNVAQARRYADRIVGIAQGRVVFDGLPEEFDAEAADRVYRFDRPTVEAPGAPISADIEHNLDPFVLRDLDRALRGVDDPAFAGRTEEFTAPQDTGGLR